MPAPITESLVIRPASEQPTPEMNGKEVLVLNPCYSVLLGVSVSQ
ncbi:hypothetical protein XBFM1_2030004 [Xenorhabdus bovienii str. feltiae Moldova]|uniref:Uncharacterized protein n=1 Tax=Xenorhabdus bovienii str. feltiae Moldova TaxID=1398200 RepID=A0A077NG90_XENBV|nr:hypothetical protein XBFM1_2030004 [Xenorhabdus bovienii str. feltiae Moldova]